MGERFEELASAEETGYGLGWKVETVPLGGEPARMAGYGDPAFGGRHERRRATHEISFRMSSPDHLELRAVHL